MSSLLALQTRGTVVFASDTALSAKVKDNSYRIHNDETKLFEYENFIMFASGKKYLRDLFIDILSANPTISEIQKVLNNHILHLSEEFSLEIVIAMKDLSKLIFFSSTDNFIYRESLPSEHTNLYTAGYKTNEIADKFEQYYGQSPLLTSLQSTYKDLSCNEIGGNLDVIILNKDKVRKHKFEIDDLETHSFEDLYKLLNLVHAEKLVGRIILSTKLWVEDSKGVVEIQSGLQTIYDANGVPRVYLGRYPTYDDPTKFDYGLRIDNGSFTMRTSTTDKRGVQIDGQGIRGFNSNGVRTFELDTSGKVSIVGSLDIRSSPDSYRGTVIDNSGLTIYGNSGQIVFRADHFGNVYYTGRLEGATGTVDNLGGSINGMDGTFKGDLIASGGTFTGELRAATGTFNGVTTGSLSAQTIDAIRIKAEQITSGKISSNLIDAQSISAATISAEQISGGTIDGDRVSVTGRMNVYGGIKLHSGTLFSGVYFDRNQIIERTEGTLAIGSNVSIGAFTEFHGRVDFSRAYIYGTVDFSHATVIGL